MITIRPKLLLSAAVVVVAALLTSTVQAGNDDHKSKSQQGPHKPGNQGRKHPEAKKHPRIVRAIKYLTLALEQMRAAKPIYHGHREKAIKATQAAIEQLRAALAFRARVDRLANHKERQQPRPHLDPRKLPKPGNLKAHPIVGTALQHLHAAWEEMDHAAWIFDGHKARAMRLTHLAAQEIHKGLRSIGGK